MVQDVPTKLSPFEWAKWMGIHPLAFAGVTIGETQAKSRSAWFQHEWHTSDMVSRDEVARAIAKAESDMESVLGFRLAPSWEIDEWQPTARPNRRELFNLNNTGLRGFGQTAECNWHHLISGGIEAKEVISAGAAIAYTSTFPPDAYLDQAEVLVPTSVVDACEIAVYYPGHNGEEKWRIRPIDVTISNATATIHFRRELALVETQIESYDVENIRAAAGETDDNFLTQVDVYRRYNDPQSQVQLVWEPPPGICDGCGGAGCAACQFSSQTGCLLLRSDPRLAQVVYKPASWNATSLDFDDAALAVGRQPDIVRLYYYAGFRDKALVCPVNDMSAEWTQAVAVYAAALLDRETCAPGDFVERWQTDLAFTTGADQLASYSISRSDLDNPFGTRRGAVVAWKKVSRFEGAISRALPW